MKTYLITITLITSCIVVNGQRLYSRIALENTVVGTRYGAAAGYMANNRLQLGVFYQRPANAMKNDFISDNTFVGIEVLVPIAKSERLCFGAQLRAGLVGHRFMAVTPGFRTSVRLSPRLQAIAGMNWRFNRPAHELGIQFNL